MISDLLASPLGQRHRLDFIATYGSATYGEDVDRRRAADHLRARVAAAGVVVGRPRRASSTSTPRTGAAGIARRCASPWPGRHAGPVILHVHSGAGRHRRLAEAPRARRLARSSRARSGRPTACRGLAGQRRPRSSDGSASATARRAQRGAPSAHPLVGARRRHPTRSCPAALPRGLCQSRQGWPRTRGGAARRCSARRRRCRCPSPDLGSPPRLDGSRIGRMARLAGSDGVASALTDADIVVLPSLSEGLPVALLEALGHGRAVVAASVGGIPETVTHGVDARPRRRPATPTRLRARSPNSPRSCAAGAARALRARARRTPGTRPGLRAPGRALPRARPAGDRPSCRKGPSGFAGSCVCRGTDSTAMDAGRGQGGPHGRLGRLARGRGRFARRRSRHVARPSGRR